MGGLLHLVQRGPAQSPPRCTKYNINGQSRLILAQHLTRFVDHKVLIQRLRHTCGFAGSALQWITSYLTDRPQFVRFDGATSNVTSVLCGVPQGSVLGPVLFLQQAYVVDVIQLHGQGLRLLSSCVRR